MYLQGNFVIIIIIIRNLYSAIMPLGGYRGVIVVCELKKNLSDKHTLCESVKHWLTFKLSWHLVCQTAQTAALGLLPLLLPVHLEQSSGLCPQSEHDQSCFKALVKNIHVSTVCTFGGETSCSIQIDTSSSAVYSFRHCEEIRLN